MKVCQDCQQPIPYGTTWGGGVCAPCRGKRAGAKNRAKAEKYGYARPERAKGDRDARGEGR